MPNPPTLSSQTPTTTNIIKAAQLYKSLYPEAEIVANSFSINIIINNPCINPEELYNYHNKKQLYLQLERFYYHKNDNTLYKKAFVYWNWNEKTGDLQRNRLEVREDGTKTLLISIYPQINKNKVEFVEHRRGIGIRDKEKGITTTLNRYPQLLRFVERYWMPIKVLLNWLDKGEVECQKDM
jgi:hypothetical protein